MDEVRLTFGDKMDEALFNSLNATLEAMRMASLALQGVTVREIQELLECVAQAAVVTKDDFEMREAWLQMEQLLEASLILKGLTP
jgi:hypothetical protein